MGAAYASLARLYLQTRSLKTVQASFMLVPPGSVVCVGCCGCKAVPKTFVYQFTEGK